MIYVHRQNSLQKYCVFLIVCFGEKLILYVTFLSFFISFFLSQDFLFLFFLSCFLSFSRSFFLFFCFSSFLSFSLSILFSFFTTQNMERQKGRKHYLYACLHHFTVRLSLKQTPFTDKNWTFF